MQSFKKKIVSLVDNGTDGLTEGLNNFKHPVLEVERLAETRKDQCVGCEFYKDEPIAIFRVKDIRIPELSKMFCDDCGCTLPYKLRQSINKCEKWRE